MKPAARLGLVFAALAAATVLGGLSVRADAKVTYTCPYTLEQTYSAALRLIRVDLGYRVTERDPQAAYIMFDYQSPESGSKTTPGSIEIVPQSENVTVVVQLPKMPQYHEEVLASALRKKLQAEYGEPARQRRPPSGNSPDGGADSSTAPSRPPSED